MHGCPSIWKVRAQGALLVLCGALLWTPLFVLIVGMLVAAVAMALEAGLGPLLFALPFAAIIFVLLVFVALAPFAQLCVGLCLVHGRLHGIGWARDATDFLRYYAKGAVLIFLLPSLGAAIHAGAIGLAPLLPFVAYWLALRALLRWLDTLPDHPNWWAWCEATLSTVGPPVAGRAGGVAIPY